MLKLEASDIEDHFFPAVLSGDNRTKRPERSVPMKWADVRETSSSPYFVVPIDAVEKGDEQILAACSSFGECRPMISLDRLEGFPSVSSIIASTRIRATVPLGNVRELMMVDGAWIPSRATLRNFTALEEFRATEVGGGPLLHFSDLSAATMKRLSVPRSAVAELASIDHLTALKSVEISDLRSSDSVAPLGALTQLAKLELRVFDWRTKLKGWKKLRSCRQLEKVTLTGFAFAELGCFDTWTRLRSLTLASPVESIEGVGALTGLRELVLEAGLKSGSMRPLAGHKFLKKLHVAIDRPTEFSSIGTLPALESLTLEGVGRGSNVVDSLKWLARCPTLRELTLRYVKLDDPDLSSLCGLFGFDRLTVHFGGPKLAAAVDRFRSERRIRWILVDRYGEQQEDVRSEPVPNGTTVGVVEFFAETDGSKKYWEIFQNLVDVVGGGASNADVERKVEQAVKAKDPGLFERLKFDSEGSFFCVYAKSESDIRGAAAVINELAEQHAKSKQRAKRPSKGKSR